MHSLRSVLLLVVCLLVPGTTAAWQDRATADLAFLTGRWQVERVYVGTPGRPPMTGELACSEALEGAYVHCRYRLGDGERELQEDVYFNFNAIYGRYEALWLSASWPIKVVMSGDLVDGRLEATAEFPIDNDVIEYVRSEHRFEPDRFEYRVAIRTSADPAGTGWREHMVERATRISS